MFKHITAIVSGGASGLGGATASYLARNGARVLVADLPQAEERFLTLEASVGSNDSSFGSLKFAKTDVRSEDDITFALDMAEEEFGEQGQWRTTRSTYIICTHHDVPRMHDNIVDCSI